MNSSCRAVLYSLEFYISDDLSHTALHPFTTHALTPVATAPAYPSSPPAERHRVAERTFVARLRAHLPARKAVMAAPGRPCQK